MRGIKIVGNQTLRNQKTVNYTAMINQTKRSDGLYLHPYDSNPDSVTENVAAKSYDGRGVVVSELATVDQGAYAKVTLPDGNVRWIDVLALKPVTYDRVLDTKKMSQDAVIDQSKRQDGLYSAPWATDAMSILENHNARLFNNQTVTIVAQAITSRNKNAGNVFDEIQLSNGDKYWIDARGVQLKFYQTVTNQRAVSYTAMIDQTQRRDGLYLHPYDSNPDSTQSNEDAIQYAGRGVEVTALGTVKQGTYAQVTLPDSQERWIDVLALKPVTYDQVLSQKPMNQQGIIDQTTRRDGLYSAPWGTEAMSILENHNAPMFNRQPITIVQEAVTSRSAASGNVFVQVKLPSGQLYWTDSRGVRTNE